MPEPTAPGEIELLALAAQPTIVVRRTEIAASALPALFDAAFGALFQLLGERGIAPTGAAFALYTRVPGDTVDIEVGLPVERELDEPVSRGEVILLPSHLPGGPGARTSYHGAYDGLGAAWGDFLSAVSAAGHRPAIPFWEIYVSEPGPDSDPATLRTDLVTLLASPSRDA